MRVPNTQINRVLSSRNFRSSEIMKNSHEIVHLRKQIYKQSWNKLHFQYLPLKNLSSTYNTPWTLKLSFLPNFPCFLTFPANVFSMWNVFLFLNFNVDHNGFCFMSIGVQRTEFSWQKTDCILLETTLRDQLVSHRLRWVGLGLWSWSRFYLFSLVFGWRSKFLISWFVI